jgi:hypothetical protein
LDVLQISDSYIPYDKTLKMIKRVAVTLALELSEDIEYFGLFRRSEGSHFASGGYLYGMLLDWGLSSRLKL